MKVLNFLSQKRVLATIIVIIYGLLSGDDGILSLLANAKNNLLGL
jgi:hypothetical protein